ncbi:MAG TPA: MFS transporter, partial [Dongiaceae bacterium]|nr:MFS transporter [Dongiaceae bacterium]
APEAIPRPKSARPWVLVATILGSSMSFIDSTVTNVALPALQRDLGATVVDVQWIVEAYALLFSALLLVGGSLGDRFGRRRTYAVGVLLFTLASVACGMARTVNVLVLARAVQGIGAALLVPGSLALISASFPKNERGRAIGTWSGWSAMTTAVGPVLGGWLIEHLSWRWVFFINVPIAVIVLLIVKWRVPESRDPEAGRRFDVAGTLLVTAGLGGIVYGLIESSRLGWENPRVIAALVGGGMSLVGFILVEVRQASPIMPLYLFRSRGFAGANLLTLLLYGGLGVTFFFLPLDLIQVHHYSATAAGAVMLPFIMIIFVLSRWSGGLVDRFGPRLPLVVGPSIAAIGFGLLAVPGIDGNYWTTFFPAIVVLGVGMAITVAPLTTTVMNAVGANHTGVASGVNNAVSRLGGLLAIALLSMVMVSIFNAELDRRIPSMRLPLNMVGSLDAERAKLGAALPPPGLSPPLQDGIRTIIAESFVAGFRWVALIAAALALASAGTAAATIRGRGASPGHEVRLRRGGTIRSKR